jgi:hypothetical protein
MFALFQQTFLAKYVNHFKKSADLHPRQGNLCTTKENFYRTQQDPTLQKIGWRPAEKIRLFST